MEEYFELFHFFLLNMIMLVWQYSLIVIATTSMLHSNMRVGSVQCRIV